MTIISATGQLIHFMFGCIAQFSGTSNLKMIGKGFVLFKISSSPSAFYIIKPTCISWLVFKVNKICSKNYRKLRTGRFVYVAVMTSSKWQNPHSQLVCAESTVKFNPLMTKPITVVRQQWIFVQQILLIRVQHTKNLICVWQPVSELQHRTFKRTPSTRESKMCMMSMS